MSEKLTSVCSTLDTLIEEIKDLIIVFDTMIMAAEYELEQDYEDTCYDITVNINKDDLTASAEQYKKDDLSEADCPPDPYYPFRGIDELPKSKSRDLTKHEVYTKLAGLLFNPLEDFVSKVNGFLTAGLDLGNTYSKAIEVLGLLQLIYDKGDAILAHFKEENALPKYCVEDFKGYLSFFYDRKIFPQLEKLSKQIKAEARLPETAGAKRKSNAGKKKKRPTKAEMKLREREVREATDKYYERYGHKPTAKEIADETPCTVKQVRATSTYTTDNKIKKQSDKTTRTFDTVGDSVVPSEFFSKDSELGSKIRRRRKSDEAIRDKLIDESLADDAKDEEQHKRYLRNKKKIKREES